MLGGFDDRSQLVTDSMTLRWDRREIRDEECTTVDFDGDGLTACADPDCWQLCKPLCSPGTATCTGPTCGDGICDALREACDSCPADCGACN